MLKNLFRLTKKLEREADYDEAVWCKIVTGNSTLTTGLFYRSPNINEELNTKIQNAIKEGSKEEYIIMGDLNQRHIQWKFQGEDQQLKILIYMIASLVDNVKTHEPLGMCNPNQIHFDIKVNSVKYKYI